MRKISHVLTMLMCCVLLLSVVPPQTVFAGDVAEATGQPNTIYLPYVTRSGRGADFDAFAKKVDQLMHRIHVNSDGAIAYDAVNASSNLNDQYNTRVQSVIDRINQGKLGLRIAKDGVVVLDKTDPNQVHAAFNGGDNGTGFFFVEFNQDDLTWLEWVGTDIVMQVIGAIAGWFIGGPAGTAVGWFLGHKVSDFISDNIPSYFLFEITWTELFTDLWHGTHPFFLYVSKPGITCDSRWQRYWWDADAWQIYPDSYCWS